jgi:peptidoglycan-N-acetylglucosamine deacetylase
VLPQLISAVGVAGVATFAGFHTMWPTSQVYGRTFIGPRDGSRRLALTYDDGPNDPYTFQMMEVLARHEVKATFFLLGRFVEQRPDIARAVVAAGHAIGSHTWDHPNLIFASSSEVRRQLQRTQRAIRDATGVDATLFRPPFGGRRPSSLRVARSLGLEPVMWSVSCYDWKPITVERITANAARRIGGGDIILLHDGEYHGIGADRSRSVAATDSIVTRYKSEGYAFVTVPEMMQSRLAVSNY